MVILAGMEKRRDTPPQAAYGEFSRLTRRQIMQGTAALVASSLLSGCGSSNGAGNQPVPDGPLTQASLTVTTTAAGSIGPGFAGLSYEKAKLHRTLFAAADSDLVGMFKLIGPSVLRIGGNSVDEYARRLREGCGLAVPLWH